MANYEQTKDPKVSDTSYGVLQSDAGGAKNLTQLTTTDAPMVSVASPTSINTNDMVSGFIQASTLPKDLNAYAKELAKSKKEQIKAESKSSFYAQLESKYSEWDTQNLSIDEIKRKAYSFTNSALAQNPALAEDSSTIWSGLKSSMERYDFTSQYKGGQLIRKMANGTWDIKDDPSASKLLLAESLDTVQRSSVGMAITNYWSKQPGGLENPENRNSLTTHLMDHVRGIAEIDVQAQNVASKEAKLKSLNLDDATIASNLEPNISELENGRINFAVKSAMTFLDNTDLTDRNAIEAAVLRLVDEQLIVDGTSPDDNAYFKNLMLLEKGGKGNARERVQKVRKEALDHVKEIIKLESEFKDSLYQSKRKEELDPIIKAYRRLQAVWGSELINSKRRMGADFFVAGEAMQIFANVAAVDQVSDKIWNNLPQYSEWVNMVNKVKTNLNIQGKSEVDARDSIVSVIQTDITDLKNNKARPILETKSAIEKFFTSEEYKKLPQQKRQDFVDHVSAWENITKQKVTRPKITFTGK